MIKEAKKRQKHIDVEAPILDFELKEPTPEPEPESQPEPEPEINTARRSGSFGVAALGN